MRLEMSELLVEYHWLWAKEFSPGTNPPGRAAYVKLHKEIQPGESISFTYHPQPPLPGGKNGRFMPEVSPAGFTVVLPPGPERGFTLGKRVRLLRDSQHDKSRVFQALQWSEQEVACARLRRMIRRQKLGFRERHHIAAAIHKRARTYIERSALNYR